MILNSVIGLSSAIAESLTSPTPDQLARQTHAKAAALYNSTLPTPPSPTPLHTRLSRASLTLACTLVLSFLAALLPLPLDLFSPLIAILGLALSVRSILPDPASPTPPAPPAPFGSFPAERIDPSPSATKSIATLSTALDSFITTASLLTEPALTDATISLKREVARVASLALTTICVSGESSEDPVCYIDFINQSTSQLSSLLATLATQPDHALLAPFAAIENLNKQQS